jgi:hypothetical protein
MAARRRAPNASEKIAACLLMLKDGGEWLIHEPLRSMGTADMICAAVEWHHSFQHALGGDTRPQNITPMLKAAHAAYTNGKPHLKDGDKSIIAKSKRITHEQEEFRARMMAKQTGEAPPKRKAKARIANRPFSKEQRLWPKKQAQTASKSR